MKEKDISDSEAGILSSASSVILPLKQGPPDGGTTAWLQVLGAFFMYFNTWGKHPMSVCCLEGIEFADGCFPIQVLYPVMDRIRSFTRSRF